MARYFMSRIFRSASLAGWLLASSSIAVPAQPGRAQAPTAGGTQIGTLTCDLSGGVGLIVTSAQTMSCRFQPVRGDAEGYTGTVRRFGLDLGVTTGARMVWAVIAPTRTIARGSLAGTYAGVAADGSVGAGAGVKLLVGGAQNSFSLQPLSVQAQGGLNLAVGVSEFTLVAAR
jgi:hypothetical protein